MHRLAQRDSFVGYRFLPVINYTGYLNNFPINADTWFYSTFRFLPLDELPFIPSLFHLSNLLTYLFTYLFIYSHDKTKR